MKPIISITKKPINPLDLFLGGKAKPGLKMGKDKVVKLLRNVLKKKKSKGKIKGEGLKGPETTKDFKKLKY